MYDLKSSLSFWIFKNILILYNIKGMSCRFWEHFQYEYPNKEYLFVYVTSTRFSFGLALTVDFL